MHGWCVAKFTAPYLPPLRTDRHEGLLPERHGRCCCCCCSSISLEAFRASRSSPEHLVSVLDSSRT